jgi:hypothetical protein
LSVAAVSICLGLPESRLPVLGLIAQHRSTRYRRRS